MLYADGAGVASQSAEQLRKIKGVIVVVCAAFGLTVSEAKTETMCLRVKGMPESAATFSVEAAGQVCNQTNELPLRHAAPSPPQVLDSLHRLAKSQSRQPPDFLSGHTYQDGK